MRQNFRFNLTYYEGDNFSDSFFHHIFETENCRILLVTRYKKLPNPGSEMWKTKLQKIVGNLLARLDELWKLYMNGMVI